MRASQRRVPSAAPMASAARAVGQDSPLRRGIEAGRDWSMLSRVPSDLRPEHADRSMPTGQDRSMPSHRALLTSSSPRGRVDSPRRSLVGALVGTAKADTPYAGSGKGARPSVGWDKGGHYSVWSVKGAHVSVGSAKRDAARGLVSAERGGPKAGTGRGSDVVGSARYMANSNSATTPKILP